MVERTVRSVCIALGCLAVPGLASAQDASGVPPAAVDADARVSDAGGPPADAGASTGEVPGGPAERGTAPVGGEAVAPVVPVVTPTVPPAGATLTAPVTADQEAVIVAERPMSAASSQVVRDRDLQLRPRSRPADIFEVAPGLIVVQHAGGGKANQYFIRGFDADHGTDLSLNVDDVPINMVTHGHGQGYSDPHFLIPELIDRIEVREGPYFAQDGDFATAGALNLRLRETVATSSVTLESGVNTARGFSNVDSVRFLGIARTDVGPVRGYVAAELAHIDGPFLNPLNFNHYNLVGRWGIHLGDRTDLSLTVMSYSGGWNASGQIPARLVGQAFEGRTFTQFDSVDPSEGGQSERHQASLILRSRPTPNDEFTLLLYTVAYRLTIFSDFTLFLHDPVHGDEIEQDDARMMSGFRATYRRRNTLGSWQFVTTVGATLRYDDIDNGLHHVAQRQRLEDLAVDNVRETALGVYAEEQVIPNRYVRLVVGARGDSYAFAVNDLRSGLTAPDPTRNGVRQSQLISPKASLVVTPVRNPSVEWDLYANFGRGFHSNDGRGTVISPTPALTMACANAMAVPSGVNCPVTPLTPATGYELGSRVRILRRFDLSVAAWVLDLDQETVWNGDDGTTQLSGPTRRSGITFEGRAQILRWLWADADVSLVNAVYRDNAGNGNAIALAPPWVLSAGITAQHPSGLFGAVRVRAIGDRPADPAGMLIAQGFTIFSAQVGYRQPLWELGLHVENLFDTTWREAQFEEDSRLRTEPAVCPTANPNCHTDIKFTAGTPFTATARLSFFIH